MRETLKGFLDQIRIRTLKILLENNSLLESSQYSENCNPLEQADKT